MLDRLVRLDRRWIFLAVGVATLLPLLFPISLGLAEATAPTRGMFNYLDGLPAGSTILLSNDYDAGSQTELKPMTEAVLRHAFHRRLRVVVMTLWATGAGITEEMLIRISGEFPGLESGRDYVYLGYNAGGQAAIANLVRSFTDTYPRDRQGRDTATLPIFQKTDGSRVRILKDFDYVITLSAGDPGIEQWVIYGQGESGCRLGGGTTAVSITQYLSYFQAGQINGLLGGLRGAAEYERLLSEKYGGEVKNALAFGTRGTQVLSVDHFLIIGFIVFSNVVWFLSRRRPASEEGT